MGKMKHVIGKPAPTSPLRTLAKSLPVRLSSTSPPHSIAFHILFLVDISKCHIINYLVMVVANICTVYLLTEFIAIANINSVVLYDTGK